ncbi:hypothetical protein GE061_015575 [Apolygus lucorum]|uniref:MADF domain-containing protein n=1 Tax=Apolygus lucorum TaxID=248454 RepID=A0A6A4J9E3_APOLU|nr:hypothetical protein GE061_015575 [Apolygus lucorum]
MNKDDLIDEVLGAPPIWDKRHKQHHNRYVLAKEWKKIGCKLGVSDSEAKTVWKTLRQEFGKQLKKLEGKSGESGPDEPASSWPYFDKLQFLKDQFTPRPSSGNLDSNYNSDVPLETGRIDDDASTMSDENISQLPQDPENELFIPSTNEQIQMQNDQRPETPSTSSSRNSSSVASFTRTGYKVRLTPQVALGRELVELEKEKLEWAKRKKTTDVNDEDVAFFNSLLPTVKLLPRREKMEFRMTVQELLFKTAFPQQTGIAAQPCEDFSVKNNNYAQLFNMDNGTISDSLIPEPL